MKLQRQEKSALVTITRQDISAGYQVAQTAHAVSQFSYKYHKTFTDWITSYNCIVSLAAKDEAELQSLLDSIDDIEVVGFCEPDIDNQLTAICFFATEEVRKKFASIPLALKKSPPV